MTTPTVPRTGPDAPARKVDPCPLCRATSATVVWSVDYETIWRTLREQWDADIPAQVRRPYDEVGQARLHRCNGCGLQYFSPLLPGTPEFYATVSQNPRYYVDDRWEFGQVVASLAAGESVIDFGSGKGAFLFAARRRAGRIVGCDHNTAFVVDGAGDVELEHEGFAELAQRYEGEFDVATSFHVLEHVTAVGDICEPARVALRPGGRLFLSTPDAARTVRSDFEVLDCPPHHLSRWTDAQFARLGELYGFDLVSVRQEPFVHRFGARRAVPLPVLCVLSLLRHWRRGFTIQPPKGLPVGLAPSAWPRGSAILAEYRRR